MSVVLRHPNESKISASHHWKGLWKAIFSVPGGLFSEAIGG